MDRIAGIGNHFGGDKSVIFRANLESPKFRLRADSGWHDDGGKGNFFLLVGA